MFFFVVCICKIYSMRCNVFLWVCTATIIAVSCGSGRQLSKYESVATVQWQRDSVYIDGNADDWPPLPFADSKLGIRYGFANDSNYFYIRLISSNELTTQRILRAGLSFTLNNHGIREDNGAAVIVFPTGNRVQNGNRMLNDRPELLQNNRMALNAVADYSLVGFPNSKTPENYDYGKPNPDGIELAVSLNDAGALVYEAAVPLRALYSNAPPNVALRKSLAVALSIDNIPGEAGRRGGGGISIGGGLGFGSFGTGGGMGLSIGTGSLGRIGGGGSNGKPTRIWQELNLTNPGRKTGQ
jgi:hypothetical protein